MELYRMTACELLQAYKAGETTPKEVVESVFGRIREKDGTIKAYVVNTEEQAVAQAETMDKYDPSLPLFGVPVAIKDNMNMKGCEATCSSKILKGYVSQYDATVVDKLKSAGAIIVGKTNMDEFAMGSSCEHSAFFPTRNPWDEEMVPGGSSGGSAAAVAADMCAMALGSDTGGSIRQPAAFCGISGMKPTYGSVSRYGLIAFASSLDQIGPMTKDVRDNALLMSVIGGHDPKDSTSVPDVCDNYVESCGQGVRGMKIGLIRDLFGEGVDAGVLAEVEKAVEVLKSEGAEIGYVDMPNFRYALTAYYLIAPAEASSNLARFDGVQYGYRAADAEDYISMFCRTRREGFGDEVKRRIMLGTYALSAGYYDAFYLKALKVRTLVIRDFAAAFETFDLVMSPTVPTTAFRIGEKLDDPLAMYMNDICTIPVNLAGVPGMSIPCGLSGGLPVGMQLMAPTFGEGRIYRAAAAYENAAGRIGSAF